MPPPAGFQAKREYGGVAKSGVGREGVRHMMDGYTYERVLALTGLAP